MTATAPQIRTMTASEVLTATFGFASKLGDSGALILSATVTGSPGGDDALTIGTPVINDAAITVDGIPHAAGQAVQATIEGGTAGITYTLTCHATRDDGDEMDLYAKLVVEA